MLKHKISLLEASNAVLQKELQEQRINCDHLAQRAQEAQVNLIVIAEKKKKVKLSICSTYKLHYFCLCKSSVSGGEGHPHHED